MDTTYTLTTNRVEPGKAVRVIERTRDGQILGEYVGYYHYKSDTYTLYPAYNPFALNTGKLKKLTLASRFVRYP